MVGAGSVSTALQDRTAAVNVSMHRSGAAVGSKVIATFVPRIGVGALRLTSRALAMMLFGTTAMSLSPVAICVDRQLTWTT